MYDFERHGSVLIQNFEAEKSKMFNTFTDNILNYSIILVLARRLLNYSHNLKY